MRLPSSATLRRRAEKGGVAVIVGVFLTMGVLLGAGALAVDVGNMMFERRQLQNGADSASRKLAQICAEDLTQCDVANGTTLGQVDGKNSANAYDDASIRQTSRPGVPSGICGRVPGAANLPSCPADALTAGASQWTECPALPAKFASGTAPYVQVYTQTDDGSGSGVLGSLLGGRDSTPTACSRYAWGELKKSHVFPLTFAECEYEEATTAPTGAFGVETSLPLKYRSTPTSTACDPTTVPGGGDYYGGFGWLDNEACDVEAEVPGWADGDTGVGAGNACTSDLVIGEVYMLPIFVCVSDSNTADIAGGDACVPGSPGGTNTWYYLKQFVAFQLTGIRLASTGGWVGSPSVAAKNECNAESLDNKCITGFFIENYIGPDGEIDPDTPSGASGPFGFQHIG